jgi:glycosyltransferase involved in cell wall biosynthesis
VSKVKKIIDLANSGKKEKYNILTFPTHERYETQLCKTGHNFYSFRMNGQKEWNKEQSPVPENYYIMPLDNVVRFVDFDFILVQSKFWQYQVAAQIQKTVPVPVIILEHTLPTPATMSQQNIQAMQQMLGLINVFISDFSRNAWGISENSRVIHHGLDLETFKPTEEEKENYVLTVANDFKNRDFCLNYEGWQRITKGIKTKLVGEGNGEGTAVCKTTEEVVSEYNKCSVYLNTTTLSPIPMSLLEAMACGCPVVSTATCMIPEVIENGVNGFISNDEEELNQYVNTLLKDESLRKKMGENARKTIAESFSEENFIKNWNQTFSQIYEVTNL